MSWEEFVYWLRRGVNLALTVWQLVVIAVVAAAIMVALLALIQWICSMVAGV